MPDYKPLDKPVTLIPVAYRTLLAQVAAQIWPMHPEASSVYATDMARMLLKDAGIEEAMIAVPTIYDVDQESNLHDE